MVRRLRVIITVLRVIEKRLLELKLLVVHLLRRVLRRYEILRVSLDHRLSLGQDVMDAVVVYI